MVPAGGPTEESVEAFKPLLESGDAIIDGGNSYFKDDIRRSRALKEKGIHYLDAGTSGGVWGIDLGDCFVIGGDYETGKGLEAIFATLAPREGETFPSPRRGNFMSIAAQSSFFS